MDQYECPKGLTLTPRLCVGENNRRVKYVSGEDKYWLLVVSYKFNEKFLFGEVKLREELIVHSMEISTHVSTP